MCLTFNCFPVSLFGLPVRMDCVYYEDDGSAWLQLLELVYVFLLGVCLQLAQGTLDTFTRHCLQTLQLQVNLALEPRLTLLCKVSYIDEKWRETLRKI